MTGQPGQERVRRDGDWTAEMDAELRARIQAGESFATIGQFFGRSRCAAIGRARRIGLSVPRAERKAALQLRPRALKPATVRKTADPGGEALAAVHRRIKARATKAKPAPVGSSLGVPFMALAFHHCRYPTSEGEPWSFCGRPKAEAGGSYCEAHALVCRSVKPLAKSRPGAFWNA